MNTDKAMKLALALCKTLDTPRSLAVYLLLTAGEYVQVASLTCSSSNYLDCPDGVESFRKDYQATDFLRKFPLKLAGVDRRKRAQDGFYESEKQCYVTNQLLILRRSPIGDFERAFADVIRRGRNWVGRVVGKCPAALTGRFGPGTTFELKGSPFSTVVDKLHTAPAVTELCRPILEHTWGATLHAKWRASSGQKYIQQARGNRFTTVPKSSTIDRGICIEPGGNLFCQLGVGALLKRRLARIGIHVDSSPVHDDPVDFRPHPPYIDGQTIHRDLARVGSVDGSWATIDLSSASDTVAYELVRDLIPDEWFQLLDSLRSPYTQINGRWHHLSKFSSMGNGYTFELETLIFCALIHGVTGLTPGRDFFVYGDDIVVPKEYSADSLAILRAAGFTPNPRKTFTSGTFRESCGGDYMLGVDVTPVRITHARHSIAELYSLHNHIRRKNPSKWRLWRTVSSMIPDDVKCWGPAIDDAFLHTQKTSLWRGRTSRDLHTYELVALHEVTEPVSLARWSGSDD